jgi:hypothetical protein
MAARGPVGVLPPSEEPACCRKGELTFMVPFLAPDGPRPGEEDPKNMGEDEGTFLFGAGPRGEVVLFCG